MVNKKAQMQPMNQELVVQKKSKLWIWILLVLILMVGGLIAYFLLSGDGSGSIGLGSSIPRPPALPS